MPDQILDISAVNTALGKFFQQHPATVAKKLKDREDFRKYCTTIYGVKDRYVMPHMQAKGGVIQGYQTSFTPKGEVEIKPEILYIKKVKADFVLQPDLIDQTYLNWLKTNATDIGKYPFIDQLVDVLMEQIGEDISTTCVEGEEVPVVLNTPGTTLGCFDGFLKIYDDAVTAGKIVPHATGTITAVNVVDKLEELYDSLPNNMKRQGLQMVVDQQTMLNYFRKRRGSDFQNSMIQNPTLDGTRCTMVAPMHWNTNRIIIAHKSNMLYLEDGVNEEMNMKTQEFDRYIKCMIDFKRGVGFGIIEGQVFGN